MSERFGLSVEETSHALSAACADQDTVVAVLVDRCDGDTAAALVLASDTLGMQLGVAEGTLPLSVADVPAELEAHHDAELAIVDR